MVHFRFLLRELAESRRQGGIFILCVALSIASLVAINSFKRDVNQSVMGDARALHGGDIIMHSHYDFSPSLMAGVSNLGTRIANKARSWEFYSIVRNQEESSTLLANILVVEDSYPLYGEVQLGSGKSFKNTLKPGTVVVAPELLGHFAIELGDQLVVGDISLKIVDVVVRESRRPVDFFEVGPRVFVAAEDLERLGLVKTGSRVAYEMVLQLNNENQLEETITSLSEVAISGQERVSSFRTARSGLKRFFDNLLFFLSLISIFTLLLAGIGMQSSLTAMLRQKEKSLAVIKALGATQRFLISHYLLLVLLYGFLGSLLGVAGGWLVKAVFPYLFSQFIARDMFSGLLLEDLAGGMFLGFVVVCFFTLLPLYGLREVKPNVMFRSESGSIKKGIGYYLVVFSGLVLLTLLVIYQLEDVKMGIVFMAGMIALILGVSLAVHLLLGMLKRLPLKNLSLRQAVRSLLRPGNSSRSILVTLGSALSLLLAIFLVQYNLHTTYVESYPEDAPNLFFVDIQPDQQKGFMQIIDTEIFLHPIIRARLKSINHIPIKQGSEKYRWSDSLSREFNLTYREHLLEDEQLLEGRQLFEHDKTGKPYLQVSVLDMVAEMGDMQLGDVLLFNIQGVEMEAKITSIRTRNRSMLYPFFYFVFPVEFLEKAPATFFGVLHVNTDSIPAIQQQIVAAYPNISVINIAKTASELGAVMNKLSTIVNFFALFSILAGGLIIVSSILATRFSRVREAVYYKVLGAKSAFVVWVFFYENLLMGILASVMGIFLAQGASWALCHYLFEITYSPHPAASLGMLLLTLIFVIILGMGSSVSILRQKPISFLREQTLE